MELYTLAESCEYKETKEEMIRDRLVVGICDASLSERMQMESDLTLDRAKKLVRQHEAVHEQQEILNKGSNTESKDLEEERSYRAFGDKKRKPTFKRNKPRPQTPLRSTNNCGRCGKVHNKGHCPAKDVECHRCHRKGHYSTLCYSKTVAELSTNQDNQGIPLDTAFLDTVDEEKASCWNAKISICKLDTGAEVTAVSKQVYQSLGEQKLQSPTKILYGPSRNPLKVLGQFKTKLSNQSTTIEQQVYVIEGLKSNLLGLPAIMGLNLVARIDVAVSDKSLKERFPKVFTGLGNLGEPYTIKLKPNSEPHALFVPRRVPLPLREKVLQELNRMESMGVISKVGEPTAWCAGMVVVPKKNGSIRICVDLKPLNENVMREVHPLPKVDDILAQMSGARIFSKLNANSGFWQIPLAKESRLLTTFLTPYGRYCFNKLPFGICSAPEHFQKRMNSILAGLEGVVCLMDDVLMFGKDKEEHNVRLTTVLQRIQEEGVTLNPEKCEFNKNQLVFLGHLIDHRGVQPDPQKTTAIVNMASPKNVGELRRFLGMVNQLRKFSKNIAEFTKPLRELLSKKCSWHWGHTQDQAFANIKSELSRPTILTLYDPAKETKVTADASSYGLGAVIMQRQDSQWRPTAYASRSMNETEQRYAQIEKEALAITWACEKFTNFILGKRFQIETDHKPLVPLFSTKHIDDLPPRILRFRLRLARFDYSISHVPGKHLYTADTLSRAPLTSDETDTKLHDEAELLLAVNISDLPASKERLEEYKRAQSVTQYARS